ncbi:hypothetical protein HNP92_001215 [Methanococcus maripaludis]|uniref:Uncharacterized protein n=1 Tax=Methanococcus maripaludis TaxID=39152 RepID=A0A7J9S6J1_METMI|nr:hypothetical protein [Methanococcus maripaludis]
MNGKIDLLNIRTVAYPVTKALEKIRNCLNFKLNLYLRGFGKNGKLYFNWVSLPNKTT